VTVVLLTGTADVLRGPAGEGTHETAPARPALHGRPRGGGALTFGLVALVFGLVQWGAGAISWQFLTEEIRSVGAEAAVLPGDWNRDPGTTAAVVAVLHFAAGAALSRGVPARGTHRAHPRGNVHALNGIPSIVYGLFGFAFFFHLLELKKSWLSGGVPRAHDRAHGGRRVPERRWRCPRPPSRPRAAWASADRASSSRVARGAPGSCRDLLGLARAAGETAPILFTAAIFAGATVPHGVVDSPVLALPYHIFVMAPGLFDPRVAQKVWGPRWCSSRSS
jgi:phosphate transport system permease protein